MMNRQKLIRAALAVVIVHFVLNLIHGWAHEDKSVAVTLGQNLFIYPVILFGPLIAYGLLHFGRMRSGFLLLALTMGGSLLFGLAWHFIIDSPDHVGHVHGGIGATVFFWTSVGLAIIEAAGAGLGGYGFVRSISETPGNTVNATS